MTEIKFTKEQYENLVKIVYLGNWMINAIRVKGEEREKYNDIAQHIYSFAEDATLPVQIKIEVFHFFLAHNDLNYGKDMTRFVFSGVQKLRNNKSGH